MKERNVHRPIVGRHNFRQIFRSIKQDVELDNININNNDNNDNDDMYNEYINDESLIRPINPISKVLSNINCDEQHYLRTTTSYLNEYEYDHHHHHHHHRRSPLRSRESSPNITSFRRSRSQSPSLKRKQSPLSSPNEKNENFRVSPLSHQFNHSVLISEPPLLSKSLLRSELLKKRKTSNDNNSSNNNNNNVTLVPRSANIRTFSLSQ